MFILVWLPLARAEQYYHAHLRRHGWRTYAPAAPADEQLATIEAAMGETAPAEEWPKFENDPDVEALWQRFADRK